MIRAILFLIFFPVLKGFSQPGVETFMRIPIGMGDKAAISLFKKEWPGAEEYDTDIWATYVVGGPVDAYLPGTFRFLIYHYGYFVGDKELRISCTPADAAKTFDSVRKRMTLLYKKPAVDSSTNMVGMKGQVYYTSWNFQNVGYKELYRLDLTMYHVAGRKTVTIQLIAYNRSYSSLMEIKENDYLHLKGR